MKLKVILFIGSAFFLVLALYMFGVFSGETLEEEHSTVQVVPVTADKIVRRPLTEYSLAVGEVHNFNEATIASEIEGVVEEVRVDIGDRVQAGQVIAVIEKTKLLNDKASAQSSVRRLELKIEDREKNLERDQSLFEEAFLSKTDLEASELELESLRQDLNELQANISNIDLKIRKSSIRSPISGLVQDRLISRGDFVTVGRSAFKIIDNHTLTVIAGFPEKFVEILKKGQDVGIKANYRDNIIRSKVTEIRPMIDAGTRSVQLVITLPNEDNALRPGSTVRVAVVVDERDGAIVIDERSLVLRESGSVVYTLPPGEILTNQEYEVKEIPIEDGYRFEDQVEILAGLEGDENIIVEGAPFLTDGARVRIVDENNMFAVKTNEDIDAVEEISDGGDTATDQ